MTPFSRRQVTGALTSRPGGTFPSITMVPLTVSSIGALAAAGAHVVGLVERARRRRNEWGSRAEAREWFGEKELFAGWDERALDLYVLDGLRDLLLQLLEPIDFLKFVQCSH